MIRAVGDKRQVDVAYARGWITWEEWCQRIIDINLQQMDLPAIEGRDQTTVSVP